MYGLINYKVPSRFENTFNSKSLLKSFNNNLQDFYSDKDVCFFYHSIYRIVLSRSKKLYICSLQKGKKQKGMLQTIRIKKKKELYIVF